MDVGSAIKDNFEGLAKLHRILLDYDTKVDYNKISSFQSVFIANIQKGCS